SSTNETAHGPLPGDEGVFAFDLYHDPYSGSKAGSAVFVCWYNYNQNALCDASFQLAGGTLVGKGAFNFNASRTQLGLLGGPGTDRARAGAVHIVGLGSAATQSRPVYRFAPIQQPQRLTFSVSAIPPAATTGARVSTPFTAYADPTVDGYIANADDEE